MRSDVVLRSGPGNCLANVFAFDKKPLPIKIRKSLGFQEIKQRIFEDCLSSASPTALASSDC